MRGYKLMRRMSDGYAPLFINQRHRYELGTWYEAQDTGKKPGYAHRPFFHVCLQPWAPHIAARPGRVWIEVEYSNATSFLRPEHQGGEWVLAQWIRPIRELTEDTHGREAQPGHEARRDQVVVP